MLFIFLLNTAAGISCALHMSHPEHQEIAEPHENHHGNVVAAHHHAQLSPSGITSISKNNPCCQGAVGNFIALAKLVPPSGNIVLHAPFVYLGATCHFSFNPLREFKAIQQISLAQRQRPPTKNIRIAIQSFLI
ncbi:MAG: hypothetical protein JWP44_42 [Mucilaginibacter sp.]|nr:hypothetical protein [Mucilaginibacter sp.]